MKTSQQEETVAPRHTMGMPRNTRVTKPGREVKAIIMRSTLSREGPEKKRTLEVLMLAFTPFNIDLQVGVNSESLDKQSKSISMDAGVSQVGRVP